MAASAVGVSHSAEDKIAEDSEAAVGNVRDLRELLRQSQARIRELESRHAGARARRTCPSSVSRGLQLQVGSAHQEDEDEGPEEELEHEATTSAPSSERRGRRRVSLLQRDEGGESSYVGSHGKLVAFVKASQNEATITDAEAHELLEAVEDISKLRRGQRSSRIHQQPLFKGTSKQEFTHTLSSMGIDVEPLTPKGRSSDPFSPKAAKRPRGDQKSEFVLQLNEELVQQAHALLSDKQFNCRKRGNIQADVEMIVHAFAMPNNLLHRYSIDPVILNNWITSIAEQYNHQSYHNWVHAMDVFQFGYLLLGVGQASNYFNNSDILALYVATIAHDVGHPGLNNAFLVNSGHELAIRYNDKSPLENMHASICFQTLRRDGLNFMESANKKQFEMFRSKVIDAILATDMKKHLEIVDRLSARVSTKDTKPFVTKDDDDKVLEGGEEDRLMLMQAFTHMADMGHCCRPWDVHRHLVVALEMEFFQQGDQERALDMPVMPMMDRAKDSAAAQQGFFLSKMVMPLLETISVMLTDELRLYLQGCISSNGSRWTEVLEKYGKLTAAELVEKIKKGSR